MPLEGFDSASKNINKKRKERKRGFPGLQGASEAIGNFVGAIPDTLLYQRREAKAREEAATKVKQAKKPPTTQESLLNIKNEYVGFNPFKEANKSGNITETVAPKPKVKTPKVAAKRPKVKPLEVVEKKVKEIKTTPEKAPKLVLRPLESSKSKTLEAPEKPRDLSDKTAARNYEKALRTYKRKTAKTKEKVKTKVKAKTLTKPTKPKTGSKAIMASYKLKLDAYNRSIRK